jgi:hypothetical protein
MERGLQKKTAGETVSSIKGGKSIPAMSTDSLRSLLAKLETDADLQDKINGADDTDAATSIVNGAGLESQASPQLQRLLSWP